MTQLNWSYQSRTKIENVPSSVTVLYCIGNQIQKIENVPPLVTEFYCAGNQIRKIENLPAGLTEFYYSRNPITHVDDLPIEWWESRDGFDLAKYNLIKHLQRRIRIRIRIKLRTRNNAARVIQKGLFNWLWSTKCKDGTTGIVLRLSLKELTQAGLIKD